MVDWMTIKRLLTVYPQHPAESTCLQWQRTVVHNCFHPEVRTKYHSGRSCVRQTAVSKSIHIGNCRRGTTAVSRAAELPELPRENSNSFQISREGIRLSVRYGVTVL